MLYHDWNPPSLSIIEAHLCENVDDEREKENSVISNIKREAQDFDIESKNLWIFSEHTSVPVILAAVIITAIIGVSNVLQMK